MTSSIHVTEPPARRHLLALLTLAALTLASSASARAVRVSAGDSSSSISQYTQNEIRTWFGKLFTEPVSLTTGKVTPADVVLGTTTSNELIRVAVEAGTLHLPEGKNSDQGYCLKTVDGTIYVGAHSDEGALYGLYDLLERYGITFLISGERVPRKTAFHPLTFDVSSSPVFRFRGLLPWDNFLCGMSGYNHEDFVQLLDRATRMRFNMVQFHFYPGLAYFTESYDGKPVSPLFVGSPVDIFEVASAKAGAPCFGKTRFFGCNDYIRSRGNPRAQAEACQNLMRRVIAHAHSRGIKTCVGFELTTPHGGDFTMTEKPAGALQLIDPLNPKNVDRSLERVRSLLQTYPDSDYYWLWQSEARGFLSREVGSEAGAKEMREKYAHWAGRPELAGDVDYAYLLREVLTRLSPAERSRFASGGWSIEHIFPGIDPDFPKESIFASLNNYDPVGAQNQMPSFRVASSGRPTWMIEWWEFDGLQWFPQFRVGYQETMYRQCAEYGVQSVTLLGWKLSAIEHNIRYLAEFSWNPELKSADFYRDYVKRLYGTNDETLPALYSKYDKLEVSMPPATAADNRPMVLGAGWCVLPIPELPMTTSGLTGKQWRDVVAATSGVIERQESLREMDRQSIRDLQRAIRQMDKQGQSWARLMINRLEFRRIYLEAMIALNSSLLTYDKTGQDRGIDAARKAAIPHAERACEVMRNAIDKYAEDTRNRGDLGVVAQLNEQTLLTIRLFCDRLKNRKSPYVELDWKALRVNPRWKQDLATSATALQYRDGAVTASVEQLDGKPTLKVEMGADPNQPFHSVLIPTGEMTMEDGLLLDFRVRTNTQESLAFMFQTEMAPGTWYALNLVGQQTRFTTADDLPIQSVNDGQWHRVTWDLHKLLTEKLRIPPAKITSLVLGAWEAPDTVITVELQDVSLCVRNRLD